MFPSRTTGAQFASSDVPKAQSLQRLLCFVIVAFTAGSALASASIAIASAAVRTAVMRIVLAWKNAHKFEASTLSLIAAVCALFPSVSEIASPPYSGGLYFKLTGVAQGFELA